MDANYDSWPEFGLNESKNRIEQDNDDFYDHQTTNNDQFLRLFSIPSNSLYLLRNKFGLWLANSFLVYSRISRIYRFLSSILFFFFVFFCFLCLIVCFYFQSEFEVNSILCYFVAIPWHLKSEAELIMPNFPYCCIRFFFLIHRWNINRMTWSKTNWNVHHVYGILHQITSNHTQTKKKKKK